MLYLSPHRNIRAHSAFYFCSKPKSFAFDLSDQTAHAADTARMGMTLEEAKQILDLTDEDFIGNNNFLE